MTTTPPENDVEQEETESAPPTGFELVRVDIDGIETDVTAAYAEVHDLDVIGPGTGEGPTRAQDPGQDPGQPLTNVADQAANKKAKSADGAGQDA